MGAAFLLLLMGDAVLTPSFFGGGAAFLHLRWEVMSPPLSPVVCGVVFTPSPPLLLRGFPGKKH